LGYDPDNIFLNDEDENNINQMNDIDRETIIDERKEKAEAAKFKYEKTR